MVLEGDPAGEIIDLANTTPNSLIAMSTHGRSGIGRWVQRGKTRAPFDLKRCAAMQLTTVKIDKPEDINFILGQSHFIKTVEDIHETLVQSVPGIKFGLAFCEASGAMLVRWTGT